MNFCSRTNLNCGGGGSEGGRGKILLFFKSKKISNQSTFVKMEILNMRCSVVTSSFDFTLLFRLFHSRVVKVRKNI